VSNLVNKGNLTLCAAMEKRFLNTKEVAAYLGMAESTIRAWIRVEKIPFSRLGRSVRFDLKKINEWLKNKESVSRREFHLDFEKHVL